MSSKSILVVEGSKTQRTLLINYLRSQGVRPIPAADGLQAIRRFKRYKPNLVLLDVVLPKLNGFEVLRQVKGIRTETAVVMMISAAGDEINQFWAKRQGADDYLVKPFHPNQLLTLVRRYITPTINTQPTQHRIQLLPSKGEFA